MPKLYGGAILNCWNTPLILEQNFDQLNFFPNELGSGSGKTCIQPTHVTVWLSKTFPARMNPRID